jgi:mannose-6-phosphate isomerase-like protein (cupin superfamily)
MPRRREIAVTSRRAARERDASWDTRSVEGIAIGRDGGELVARRSRHHRILAELAEPEVVELRFGPDFEGVEPHTHDDFVDSFFVLDGEAEFTVGDALFRADAGSFVAAPPGVRHGFRNATGGELRLLNIHAPNAGFAEGLRRA